MVKILITDGMDASRVQQLKSQGYEVEEKFYEPEALKGKIKDVNVVVVRSATKVRKEIIDAAAETGKLKLIIRGGVGVDNIDVDYAVSKGITVRNTPNSSSASVAELALGHMFALARHIHIANVTMRKGEWNKKAYKGIELDGKTLGLIGFGRIAKILAKKAHALGMNILYYDMVGKCDDCPDFHYVAVDELLKKSDFISFHVPGGASTYHLYGKEQFAKMKDGVYIIDCGRGGVIDADALMDAIDSGKVAGAALDVFEQEPVKNEKILSCDKISMTPHIGGSTKEGQARIGEEVVSIINEYFPV